MKDIIRERLRNMAEWAEIRKKREGELGGDKYVRIGGNGFRAVSVAKDTPLTGFAKSSVKTWDTVKGHFAREAGSVEGKKEERRLQAFMIRHALRNNKSLVSLIGKTIKSESFDDILFSFDEISLGDKKHPITFNTVFNNEEKGIIRCDLLCVAKKEGKGYPLLIELKYSRHLGRLLEQLEEFSKQISEEYREEFEQLLKSDVGFEVDCSTVYQMMIWPSTPSGREAKNTRDMLIKSDVVVFEYTKVSEDNQYLKEARFKCISYD